MYAYTYQTNHTLQDFQITMQDVPVPVIKPKDVLVKVKAISFNPIDYKIRQKRSAEAGQHVILGWDAAGIIEEVGSEVSNFLPGDEVFYAGNLMRDGSYSEKQAVDYRLVAKKPKTLSFAESAALPLTTLTAWEALFERGIEYTKETRVLIIGGAGGVGSSAIQLLKAKTAATVIATASRPDTVAWCKNLGADYVIGRDLSDELRKIGVDCLDVIFCTTHTDQYLPLVPNLLRPFGHFCLIDDPKPFEMTPFKLKALSIHYELMFAKSMHEYKPESQGAILTEVAKMVDAGKLRSTLNTMVPNGIAGVKQAHSLLEEGQSIGKMVMELS